MAPAQATVCDLEAVEAGHGAVRRITETGCGQRSRRSNGGQRSWSVAAGGQPGTQHCTAQCLLRLARDSEIDCAADSLTRRTAGCGPACPVVWEGRSCKASPYPDQAKSGQVFGHRRKKPEMFRVGLYARVSTQDQQTIPLQMRAMREYAATRGWTITLQVKEVGSGASERELRQKLIEAARRREIDVVLVWRLDRWGRSLPDLVSTLEELNHLGVGFVSLTEALDLTTPTGRAMAGLLSVFNCTPDPRRTREGCIALGRQSRMADEPLY